MTDPNRYLNDFSGEQQSDLDAQQPLSGMPNAAQPPIQVESQEDQDIAALHSAEADLYNEQRKQESGATQLAAMRRASSMTPDYAAYCDKLSTDLDVPFNAVTHDKEAARKEADVPAWESIARFAPKTSALLQEKPEIFHQVQDDAAALKDLEVFKSELKKNGVTDDEYNAATKTIFDPAESIKAELNRSLESGVPYVMPSRQNSSFFTNLDAVGTQFNGSAIQSDIGMRSLFNDMQESLGVISSDEALANRDNLTREYKDSALRSSEVTPNFEHTLFPKTNEFVFGGASSLVQSAPAMAVGLLNPLAGVLVAGAQTTTTAYPKYSSRGGSMAESLLGAGIEGLIEMATEKNPMGFAAEHLGKMSIKNFAKQFLGKEMIGEQLATFGQDLTDTLVANPNKTMAQFWDERPEAMVQTLFAVGMNTAAMASVQHIANTAMKYDGSYEANQKLKQEMEIVKKLQVAGLNTVRAKQILDNMDGDSPQDVYVDPQQLFNQDEISLQQFKNAMPNYSAQLDEALAVGGLLRMDKNELMLAMRNDEEGWASLSQHLKVDPAADSLYESTQSMDALTDELNKLADKRIAESKDEAAARDQWEALKEKARQRLANSGMDKEAIEQAATMDASVAHAFSTRTGLDAGDILSGQFGTVSRRLSGGEMIGGVFNQYAGEQALNADLTALQRAKQAVDSGADPEQVRQETGWHKWEDGKWRFEIDDSAARVLFDDVSHARMKEIAGDWITNDDFMSRYADSPEAKSMRIMNSMRGAIKDDGKVSRSDAPMLDEVLDHPALFAAYPDLAAVRVVIDDSMPIGEAAYIPEGDVILLSPVADNAQKKSLLLHEVQHAIQEREGFARGGSVDEFMSPANNELAARKSAASEKVAEINAKLKTATGEEYQQLLAERSSYVADAQIDGIDIMENANDQYKRLAGEVEARDTGSRAGMSAEERKLNKPYISQGIPDDQVIVRMGDGGLRSNAENDAAKYNADAAPTELSDEAADDLVTLYQELGSDDDNFQYARKTGDDLDADIISALPEGTVQTADEAVIMAAQMDAEDAGAPDIVDVKKYSIPTKELLVDANDKPILKDGKKQYATQKRDAYVYINDAGEYWTDLSDLKRAGGVGGIIYTKVADFAEKNGGVFRGDPLGLSDDALLKRTEHMASGIARRKDTGRFIPHERQLTLVDKDHATSPLNTRARAMKWVKGNDTINRREIVKTAFHNITQVMPELRHAWIDPDTGRILVRGTPLNTEFDAWVHELQTLDNAQDGQRGEGQSGSVAKQREPLAAYRHLYASASIKRQLLANTLARYVGESAERRRQILDRLGEISKDLESYDGRKLFYQSKKAESAKEAPNKKLIAERDAEYMAAVERGDMEAAQRLVDEAAAEAGYNPSTSERMEHSAPNSTDGFSVSLDKIRESGMVPDDYWTHPQYYTNDSRERSAHYDVRDLFRRLDRKKSGEKVTTKITVYRSIPKNTKDTKLRNGDWVSTNRSYAVDEGLSIPGGYRIVSEKVEAASLYWDGNSIAELGFDNGKGYAYKNTKNNRKLLDAIVRDYDGNIVPLSKRFNSRKTEEFYQNDTSPRGTFDPVTRAITLMPDSDLSTYLHESGHLYLEVMASLAGHETASEGLRADMDAALKWFGVKGENASERLAAWNAMTLEEKRNFHEKWAESFEQYLFEGVAPSPELREAFKNFRQWLTHVYKSMAQFLVGQKNAKLNDEMRGVFDRILASEEQINTMREARNMLPLFTVRPANITNDEWERYQKAEKDFVEKSIEQLTSRSLRDMKWLSNAKNETLRKLQREAAQARREARMDAITAALGQPVYRAWLFLTAPVEGVVARNKQARSSEHVDTARDSLFTAIAKLGGLNKEEAVSQYGIDPKDFLRKGGVFGKPVLRVDGGLSPDAMAEALSQHNYLPLDEHGKWDIRDLEDLLREEAAGNPQYSTDVDMDVLLGEPQRAFFDAENVEYMGGRLNRIDIRNMFDDVQLAEMAGIDPYTGEAVATEPQQEGDAGLQGYMQSEISEGDDDALRKEFTDTEKAYGGEAAYEKAKADGKTKLNYRQWVQVRTPRFKEWFGDWENDPANASKGIDQDTGEPLVVYHGTDATRTVFDRKHLGRSSGRGTGTDWGFFFAKDRDHAEYWANNAGGDRVVESVYLRIENPLVIEDSGNDGGATLDRILDERLQDSDHDGAIIHGMQDDDSGELRTAYLVFDSEQIKSAIGNSGAFDGSNPNILRQNKKKKNKDPNAPRTLESMGVLSDDGIHPDLLADYFGFPSVEAMVKALLTAPDPLSEINRLTDEIMVQRYADLATPQAIEQAALAALHSEAHSKFLATELAILNRAVGKPRLVMQAAKQYADRIVSALRIADLNPAQYEMQAAKAGKETEKLLGQNKTADAAMAKRNQILHDATARRVREERENVAKALRFFDRTEKAARNGKLRADVGAQVLTLLDTYDLRKGTTLKAAELADRSLAEFVQQQSEAMDMPMPSLADTVLHGSVKRSYKTMSVEEFNGLVDAVKYLEAVGRREYAMYKAVRDQSFAQERSAILERLREYWPDAFDEEGNPLPTENAILKTGAYNTKKKARSAVHELLTPETVTNILEGGEFGQVHDSLFARLSNAMTDRSILMKELHEKLQPFMDAYTWKERREFGKKDIGTAAIGEPLSRENALVAALLAGSKEGRDRLANYGWNDARIAQVVNLLDAKDIALANAIFDMFDNTLWPKLEALNKRTMGVSPPKVLPIALQAKNGTLTGGYFPIRYDGDMDARSSSFDDKQALDLMKNGIGLSAKTNQSSSQARVDGVKMRPLLSLSVMSRVAGETAHDISLREAVMDSARLLNNAEIAQGIQNIVGMEGWKSLKKNLGDIASPPHDAGGMFAGAANFARRNVVTALMSGVGTAVQNFTGLLPAFSRVHKGLLLKEIADVPHLIEKYKDTIEKSAYMRERFGQFERDLVHDVDKLGMKKGVMPDQSVWFAMMAWVDRVVSVWVWQAAYREGVAKGVDAVEYADHIVRQTQGGGRLIDRAPIMRGGALQQLFTMFYSYFNGQLNMVARDAALAKREVAQGEVSKAAARLAASAIFVWILPAVVSELTRQAPDDEDDEDKLKRVVRATILYPAAMIPLLRDFAPFVYDKIAGNRAFDPRLTPVQGFVSTLSRAATAAGDIGSDDFDEKDFKALMMGVGFTFNLPAILFTDVVLGTKALLDGETDDIRAPLIGTAPSR